MTDHFSLAPEVTPEPLYLNRRAFLRLGAAVASMVATGMIYRRLNRIGSMSVDTDEIAGYVPARGRSAGFDLDEAQTPLEQVGNYNNFYEFTTDKEAVGSVARAFVSRPWQLVVDGMVHKPGVFDVQDLMKAYPL